MDDSTGVDDDSWIDHWSDQALLDLLAMSETTCDVDCCGFGYLDSTTAVVEAVCEKIYWHEICWRRWM